MHVTLCSAFRNSAHRIERYFEQVDALHAALIARGDRLTLILGEGDSYDGTRGEVGQHLEGIDYAAPLLEVSHGGPEIGSVVHPLRFKQLAHVWSRIWAHIPEDADAVLFVESDLVWAPQTMLALLDALAEYPAIAPMILYPRINIDFFYDSWAFRKDGEHICAGPPYFPGWERDEPIQVDSAGSVLAIRGALARQLTWPEEDVVVGVCRQVYELGGSVWLHNSIEVIHP